MNRSCYHIPQTAIGICSFDTWCAEMWDSNQAQWSAALLWWWFHRNCFQPYRLRKTWKERQWAIPFYQTGWRRVCPSWGKLEGRGEGAPGPKRRALGIWSSAQGWRAGRVFVEKDCSKFSECVSPWVVSMDLCELSIAPVGGFSRTWVARTLHSLSSFGLSVISHKWPCMFQGAPKPMSCSAKVSVPAMPQGRQGLWSLTVPRASTFKKDWINFFTLGNGVGNPILSTKECFHIYELLFWGSCSHFLALQATSFEAQRVVLLA